MGCGLLSQPDSSRTAVLFLFWWLNSDSIADSQPRGCIKINHNKSLVGFNHFPLPMGG
jgi:hypothetical protein